jgi:glucose-6-phosphate 1-dehydrogenase
MDKSRVGRPAVPVVARPTTEPARPAAPAAKPAGTPAPLPDAADVARRIGTPPLPAAERPVTSSVGFHESIKLDLKPAHTPQVAAILDGSPGEVPPGRLIVFGATGDHAAVGLVRDALLTLADRGAAGDHRAGFDPQRNPVVLVGRSPRPLDEQLERMRLGRQDGHEASAEMVAHLRTLVLAGNPDGKVAGVDMSNPETATPQLQQFAGKGSAVAYAALPPQAFGGFLAALKKAGFDKAPEGAQRTIVLEKPLGTDPADARRLVEEIDKSFSGQVLLVDHFAPMLTNMLAVRTNPVFDEALSAKYVESAVVHMDEKIASNDRPYFRDTGLLLDVVQNHLMTMLSTFTADLPDAQHFSAVGIRSARAEILEHVQVDKSSVRRGQFDGFNDPQQGAPEGAAPSNAETFVGFDFKVATPRWSGTQFSLRASKGASRDGWGVEMKLRALPAALAEKLKVPEQTKATLEMSIHPQQQVAITLADGRRFELPLDEARGKTTPYVRLFVDAFKGESALYMAPAEQLAGWNVAMQVEEAWQEQGDARVVHYPRGTAPEDIGRGT